MVAYLLVWHRFGALVQCKFAFHLYRTAKTVCPHHAQMVDKGPDRERTLNDITNTGVTAALIGGARVRGWAGV